MVIYFGAITGEARMGWVYKKYLCPLAMTPYEARFIPSPSPELVHPHFNNRLIYSMSHPAA